MLALTTDIATLPGGKGGAKGSAVKGHSAPQGGMVVGRMGLPGKGDKSTSQGTVPGKGGQQPRREDHIHRESPTRHGKSRTFRGYYWRKRGQQREKQQRTKLQQKPRKLAKTEKEP